MAKIHNLGGNEQQPQQTPQVSLRDSTSMKCGECDYDVFLPATKIRKISKLLTGATQDAIIPIDVFVCAGCGTVNQELLPQEIKNLDD